MRLTVDLDRARDGLIDIPVSWLATEKLELVDADSGETVMAEFAWVSNVSPNGGHVAVLRLDESSWKRKSSRSRIDGGGSDHA